MRNEREANEALAQSAVHTIARTMARDSVRKDWRAVLQERDDKRDAERRNLRMQRRTHPRTVRVGRPSYPQAGRARVAVMLVQVFAAACVALLTRWG